MMASHSVWCGILSLLSGIPMDEENIDCYLYLCILVFMAAYLVFFFLDDIYLFLEKIMTGTGNGVSLPV